MKILVSDPLDAGAIESMRCAGLVVAVETDLSPEELHRKISDYDCIIVRSATKVSPSLIDAAPKLKLIVRAGVGTDNIDVEYAQAKGITLCNTPQASSNSVAELVIGHIFSVARHISRGTLSIKGGKWEKKTLIGCEITGKILGIIGIGRIGRLTAQKAVALGMKVIAYDTAEQKDLPEEVEMVQFNQLLARSDFITLHVPLSSDQRPLIGAEELSKMKDGSYLINCSRGGVVDEIALISALQNGKLRGAALDVFTQEPPINNPLIGIENLSLTPHIGAATVEAQARVGAEAAQIVIDWARRSKSCTCLR
ncbi:hydroxyacid dehydrogenase [Candidatus Acetothermia bacterium]|jgi:D-3-phosphoglycerate dehydrogenase|nr:hydroxyacid dehydrogenase [Candidatus Acetothermia bacterium]MCI2427169.1 hydroxyacid dehydrogenase [Candidatus Acetothermia bacterium]MCI2428071.1 hydroxyacid dehydrogenase [Candidatus Acetothermia bacterium]